MLHGTRRASAAPPRNGTKPHPIPAGAPCDTSRKVFHNVARDAPRVGGTPTKRNETPPDSRRPAVRHFAKSVPRCCTGRAARRRHPHETPRNRTLRSSGPPASRSGRLRLVDGDGGPPIPPGLRFLEQRGGSENEIGREHV